MVKTIIEEIKRWREKMGYQSMMMGCLRWRACSKTRSSWSQSSMDSVTPALGLDKSDDKARTLISLLFNSLQSMLLFLCSQAYPEDLSSKEQHPLLEIRRWWWSLSWGRSLQTNWEFGAVTDIFTLSKSCKNWRCLGEWLYCLGGI